MSATDWINRAACKSAPPEVFHPVEVSGKYLPDDVAVARTWCNQCPVRDECLEANLSDPFGIFGGLDPDERTYLRKRKWTPQHRAVKGDQRTANPPKTLRSDRECPEPGRTRSIVRHLAHGQRLCLGCASLEADLHRTAERDKQVMDLAVNGHGPSEIAADLGLPRDVVAGVMSKYRKRETARQEVAA